MQADIKQTFLQAAEGLFYPSESDYPFEYFEWTEITSPTLTKKELRQFTGLASGVPVRTLTLDQFFEPVTSTKDWYGEEEKATVLRFLHLKQVLQDNLTDIQIFKAGKVEFTVFIAGKTISGKWAGLSTKVVES